MLKFKFWSNHIPISQSLSSKLDLKEMRLSVSHTSIWSLWVSTWDQPGVALYNLNLDSPKFSLLNLNEAWIAINAWSFFLIFFFSSSLKFFPCYVLLSDARNQQKRGTQQSLGIGLLGMHVPRERWCGMPKGRERERKRGRGTSLLTCGVASLDALRILGKVLLNRHKDWILFNFIIQVLLDFLLT